MSKETTWGKGFKLVMVRPRDVAPNPWNPNRMDDETFAKEKLSIQNNGFIDPIKVRELPDGTLEIVDGEHRARCAGILKISTIPAINLGPIPDAQAKKLTIIANELRGSPEPVLLAALMKDLAESASTADLAMELPMSSAEIDAMIKAADTFDWAALSEGGEDVEAGTRGPTSRGGPVTVNPNAKQVRIGSLKFDVPDWVADKLYEEYERSAAAIGSHNPELVMRDWLTRLETTAEDAAVRATSVPKPAPKKTRKKEKAA